MSSQRFEGLLARQHRDHDRERQAVRRAREGESQGV